MLTSRSVRGIEALIKGAHLYRILPFDWIPQRNFIGVTESKWHLRIWIFVIGFAWFESMYTSWVVYTQIQDASPKPSLFLVRTCYFLNRTTAVSLQTFIFFRKWELAQFFNQMIMLNNTFQTVSYVLRKLSQWLVAFERLDTAFCLNANFVAESLINVAKPVLGSIFDKLQVHGTNREKWMPKILKALPKDQIAEWYGGPKDFVPLKVFG